MLTTYTVYLRGGEGVPTVFEPVMCETRGELMDRVRDILKRRPACHAADVFLGDTELFQVKQPPRRG